MEEQGAGGDKWVSEAGEWFIYVSFLRTPVRRAEWCHRSTESLIDLELPTANCTELTYIDPGSTENTAPAGLTSQQHGSNSQKNRSENTLLFKDFYHNWPWFFFFSLYKPFRLTGHVFVGVKFKLFFFLLLCCCLLSFSKPPPENIDCESGERVFLRLMTRGNWN